MKKTILALCALSLLSACGNKGEGDKNGTITKLAHTGLFCKTWEMEIVRGGLTGGTGVNGAPFDVTIEDPALLKVAKQAIAAGAGAEIRIHYRTEVMTFCRSDSDDNFLTSIEIIRPGAGAQPTTPVAGSVTLSGAQLQQMLDNQTRSINQNERLVHAVETQSANH